MSPTSWGKILGNNQSLQAEIDGDFCLNRHRHAVSIRGFKAPQADRLHRILVQPAIHAPLHHDVSGEAIGADGHAEKHAALDARLARRGGIARLHAVKHGRLGYGSADFVDSLRSG